jgi:F-type H+-transporting ATPase subunit b
MNISWFEIIAQIINFFIILFILQKLLYKPVMKAMKERQERIQKSQIEANAKMKDATELMDTYDKKMQDIQKEKREILEEARTQAQEKKEGLLEDYKNEAEHKRRVYLKEIEDEKENFTRHLRENLGESAVKIASHILNDISSKELQSEVFNTFILRLKNLNRDIPDPEDLTDEDHAKIHSFSALSQYEKKTVEEVLGDQLKNVKEISYEMDSELVLGYELHLETYTIHTNIKNYLDEIEKDIIENLNAN